MEKLKIPNEERLPEIGRMTAEGIAVTLRGKGYSLLPFIKGGKDLMILTDTGIIRSKELPKLFHPAARKSSKADFIK